MNDSLMKKLLLVCSLMVLGISTTSAQDFERGIFNHFAPNVSIGTEGLGIGVAAPCTDYLEFGLGVNFFPSASIKGDVNIGAINTGIPGYTIPKNKVNIKGGLGRTTFDFKANFYPFGSRNSLFIAAGFSFGGKKIAKLTGHSDAIQDAIAQYPQLADQIYAEIDKYDIKFDANGDVKGDARVNAFRPYLGLGYGRLVTKHRVGFRFELGCQFMGKIKVYQNGKEVVADEMNDADDDVSKFIDKFKVYPVLKLTLNTRIL